MSQYLDRPLLFSGQGTGPVTLETPRPILRSEVINLLRGLLDSQNFELFTDTASNLYRARPKPNVPVPARGALPPEQQAVPRPQGASELFVIPLKHMRAVDIAVTLNALYGRTMSFADSRARTPMLADDLRANQVPPAGGAPVGLNNSALRIGAPTGEVTIIPDAHANTLLLRASRSDFELVRAIVDQLDVRPLQVMIEVLIAEVQRDKLFSINVNGALGETSINHGNLTMKGTVGTEGVGDFALKVMRLGDIDLNATLSIAASHGDARILSRPVVITANNQQAEIVVGSQRPFVQVSRTLPTDAGVRDQVVQYRDVGTKLTVRPTISSDGLVQLEVAQEISNATAEQQFNAPVISTRSVQTQLLIRDGQTVVLGGLTDTERQTSQGGIPFLSSIPLIGGLFGHASRQTTETELFIFLTPRVIRTDDDAARLTTPFREKADRVTP
ncbi:MAG TPA: secretin N-terminal domain-containing protein [Gemmatimonadaceae bacterium]